MDQEFFFSTDVSGNWELFEHKTQTANSVNIQLNKRGSTQKQRLIHEIFCVPSLSVPVSGDLSRNLVPLLCDSRQYPGILLSNQIGSISAPKTSYFCVFMCFKQNFEPISLKQYKFLFHCYATVVNIHHCQFYKNCFNFRLKINSLALKM